MLQRQSHECMLVDTASSVVLLILICCICCDPYANTVNNPFFLRRPAHKKECKQQAQKQLRVSISSKPPGGGKGAPSSWVGLSQGDVSKWAAGQVNGTGRGKTPPQAKPMTGNVSVKHEKLFDVKIQVGSPARCMAAGAGAWQGRQQEASCILEATACCVLEEALCQQLLQHCACWHAFS